jgi:hypothetical protein
VTISLEALQLDVPQGFVCGAVVRFVSEFKSSTRPVVVIHRSLSFFVCMDIQRSPFPFHLRNLLARCVRWLAHLRYVVGVLVFLGHGLEHPETLEEFFLATSSRKMEAISLTAPVALGLDALLYFSDGTKRLTIGMVSVLGICLGALASSKFQGTFRWESFSNVSRLEASSSGRPFDGHGRRLWPWVAPLDKASVACRR